MVSFRYSLSGRRICKTLNDRMGKTNLLIIQFQKRNIKNPIDYKENKLLFISFNLSLFPPHSDTYIFAYNVDPAKCVCEHILFWNSIPIE